MRPLRRWVRPAIATFTITAVGVAAVATGAFFAPKSPVAPAKAAFPILQPIGYGDRAPAQPGDGSGEPATSPEQGTRTVRVDADGNPLPGADLANTLHELSTMDDPGEADWRFPIHDGADDPCSPADDSDPAGDDGGGCPDGLHGALFSEISPGSLRAHFATSPPAERTNPYELNFCPQVDHDDVSLPFGIASTAPGTVTFSYWPRWNESAKQTITLTSTDEQTANWQEHLATADSFEGDWTWVQHCGVMHGLTPYVSYEGKYTIHDILGRDYEGTPYLPFRLPDDRTAPDFVIRPLGKNAILMSAPHTSGSHVEFNLQVLDSGEAPDCSKPSDDIQPVSSHGQETVDVSSDYLAAHHYRPEYTKRTTLGAFVPSGSTVLACVAVFKDDRPAWEWDEAQVRLSKIVQTPDTPRPIIAVDTVYLDDSHADVPVTITASWEDTGPSMACELYRDGEMYLCGADRHEITRGDAWITVEAGPTGGQTTRSAVLPLGNIDCYSGCVTPSTAWYRVPIKLQERPGQRCGSGIVGPCPPTIIGTAYISVGWQSPRHGGHDVWRFSRPTREDVHHTLDPLPQMDWMLGPTVLQDLNPRLDRVELPISVDRPVDFTATLVGNCELPGANLEVSGHATPNAPGHAEFTGACPGEGYHTEVRLTDADGNTNLFGGPEGHWWNLSLVTIQPYQYDVALGGTLPRAVSRYPLTKITGFTVSVDNQNLGPYSPGPDCFGGTIHSLPSFTTPEPVRLSQKVRVEVSVRLSAAQGDLSGSDPICVPAEDAGVVTMTKEISIDDLLNGVTITASDDAPYPVHITLHAVPPRG